MSMPYRSNIDLGNSQLLNAVAELQPTTPGSQVQGHFYFHQGTKTIHFYTGTADYDLGIAAHSLSEMGAPTAALSFGGFKGTNVGAGVAPTDIATMANLTSALSAFMSNMAWKPIIRSVFTTNVASLAAGPTTNDGITLNNGDRVLLTAQTTTTQNGVYTFATGGVYTRIADDNNNEMEEGSTWEVTEGTVGAPSGVPTRWYVSNTGVITVGTTAISIIQIGAGGGVYTAGTNVSIVSNVISVPNGTFTKKATALLGNGSASSFVVTHNLGLTAVSGVFPMVMEVLDMAGNSIGCDMQSTTANTATFAFGIVPTANQFLAVMEG